MAEKSDEILVAIARDVFGWQWREDWQCWCPPRWPSLTGTGYWQGERYQQQLIALQQHGGAPYGISGIIDERGRPVIPDYIFHPEATEILWQWLHAQPDVQAVRLIPLPIPPDSLRGCRPWRCEIVSADGLVSGEGNMHREALCRAVAAWATARAGA